ncbi:MAG: hypothetical protein CBC59_000320 [Euryarchaeota archaeon TMED99]|nr:MAG: hypothetical protein CBC59_000320 [Euryarchaeota archaeon TMED99]
MGVESIVTSIALVGGFVVGLWYIFTRKDVSISARQGMNPEGLRYGSGAPGFGSAKKEIDRKLALVETRRRRQQAISSRLAVENAERLAREQLEHSRIQQEAERQMMMENARVAAQEEARLASEAAQKVREEQEEARRREEEEARLAIERENQRQADFLAAEESRLAEIAAAQQQQIASSSSNSKAIKELQARLAREGAKSSDVQVSLMWNNYNDLDLHIVCPSGERIHGGNKTSACGGELDVDANVRAETRKPVENVFWPEGTAPGGQYHVYVHYYKKHKKRRSKDPTKFQIMVNNGGETTEYTAELSKGDPIMQVCSFDVSSKAEREQLKRELETELDALKHRFIDADIDGSAQLSVEELAVATGMTLEEAKIIHEKADKDGDGTISLDEYLAASDVPSAPDLESLSTGESED